VTTILKAFVTLLSISAALTVKLKVPAVVGVPEMSPVASFILKPPGKLPAEIFQVIGVIPIARSISVIW